MIYCKTEKLNLNTSEITRIFGAELLSSKYSVEWLTTVLKTLNYLIAVHTRDILYILVNVNESENDFALPNFPILICAIQILFHFRNSEFCTLTCTDFMLVKNMCVEILLLIIQKRSYMFSRGGITLPPQVSQKVQQAVGQAVTQAAVNELANAFSSRFK